MSDEEEIDKMVRVYAAIKRVLAAYADEVMKVIRAAFRMVSIWRQHIARAEWRWAQRSARMLSRHPDLAAMDGWLDRMYPGIP